MAYTLFLALKDGLYHFSNIEGKWKFTRSNLGNINITSLVHDAENKKLYAGTEDNGILYSIDEGISWQPVAQNWNDVIKSLAWDSQENVLYAGTSTDVFFQNKSQQWESVGESLQNIETILFEPQNRILLAGTGYGGVYRYIFGDYEREGGWEQIVEPLPGGSGVTSFVLDTSSQTLIAATADRGVFRYDGEGWQSINDGLPNNDGVYDRVTIISSDTQKLYASVDNYGIYSSDDDDQTWQQLTLPLIFARRIIRAMVAVKPLIAEILSGGYYWQEPFPTDPEQRTVSREALRELREIYDDPRNADQRQTYPWRLGFLPATGLPALLRTRLDNAPTSQPNDQSPSLLEVLNDSQTRAILGLDEGALTKPENQFQPGPIIKLKNNPNDETPTVCHYTYHQFYNGFRVLGGSLRIHGLLGDKRAAITSSYLPIPDNYPFGSNGNGHEAPLEPRIGEEETKQIAVTAVIQTQPVQDAVPILVMAIRKALLKNDQETLVEALGSLREQTDGAFGRLVITADLWLLQRSGLIRVVGRLLVPLVLFLSGANRTAVNVEIMPVNDNDLAITAFAAAYRLISRVRVHIPGYDPWYVLVDRKSGQVLGEPLTAVARTQKYYQNSGEAWPAKDPTGEIKDINISNLQTYVAELPDETKLESASEELTNIAVHAQQFLDHLITVCGVEATLLQGYTHNGTEYSPGLEVRIDPNSATGFFYGDDTNPKQIRFQKDNGNDILVGDNKVFAPALDPEVVRHEFTHGFSWLLNPDPWDTPDILGPFSRALQEGYAMYLARSVAVNQDENENGKIWARAAYRENDWKYRWQLDRTNSQAGCDLLPAPNVYPAGSFKAGDLANYDVGMIWARALWDLRRVLGNGNQADKLVVRTMPYLHGYIANFELAAEAILDVDIKLMENLNLANGSQPIWAGRGIAAGQGVYGFAQANDGTLIAATDAGILLYSDVDNKWNFDSNSPGDDTSASAILTGIVAVAGYDDTLYAAVQLPPNSNAGSGNTQWQPNMYSRTTDPSNDWTPLGNWPDETNEATPLSLLLLDGGTLLVGTSRGVYQLVGGSWQITGKLDPGNDQHGSPDDLRKSAFAALGLVKVDSSGTIKYVHAITPNSIRRIKSDKFSTWNWKEPTSGIFYNGTARPTAIVEWKNDVYIGTLENGLWKSDNKLNTKKEFSTESTPSNSSPAAILALAAYDTHLYMATDQNVIQFAN
ncbi:MAG: hypothetical protein DWQ04_13435, partial [Chloroflexi bacterium]